MFVGTLSFSQTFYSENFGTPAATTLITAYTGWQVGSPVAYSGSGDVRTSSASSGYSGASGSGNVFLTSTAGRNLIISGLNSSAYVQADIQLSFGYLTNSTATQLTVETSTDGSTWSPVTFTQNGNTSWNSVTVTGGQIPSSTTLSLRFTQPAAAQMRLDDIKLASVSASCTLVLGTPVAVCDASTLALDTYTVTIPFTGAGNATYVITPTTGSVGGDNPTSVAAGNIVISGITEGTAYSVTVTGGTCNFTLNGNSPECKPVNTLPFSDSFPYTVSGSLNAEQKWSILNSGDNITVASGNLSYTGITSAGNSVSFVGTGAESRTFFTDTNSGELFVSMLSSVTDLTNVTTDLANTYFAALTDNSGTTTNARIWIRKNASQYQFGLGEGTAPTVWSPNLYNIGSTQYLVLGYNFTNNRLSLYENPTVAAASSSTIGVTPTAAFTSLGGLILRQDGAALTPAMTIDELTIALTPNFILGTTSFSQIDGLKMYPNPAKNNLYIETALNSNINVSIVNMLGKEVVKANVVNNTVNVSNLTSGIYIVKITEEGKTSTRKLIIE